MIFNNIAALLLVICLNMLSSTSPEKTPIGGTVLHATSSWLAQSSHHLLRSSRSLCTLRGGSWMDEARLDEIRRGIMGASYGIPEHERKSPSPSQSAIDNEEIINQVFPDMRARGMSCASGRMAR
eukprot:756133-Hanusia_phi.AAC.5